MSLAAAKIINGGINGARIIWCSSREGMAGEDADVASESI